MSIPASGRRDFSLIFWMIALGVLAIYAGGSDMMVRWPALVFGARLCDVLILASGIALLAAGLWQSASRRMFRPSSLLAAGAATGFSATLFFGVWSGAIPCSGSS